MDSILRKNIYQIRKIIYIYFMNKIKEIIYFIRCDLIYLISLFIPKKERLWVFGAWFGEKYADNPRYFFEFMYKNHPGIRCVWLTKNRYIERILKEKGLEVYDACSLLGIFISMRAKFCLITHNLYDINEYACGAIKIIQLRRGTPFLVPPSHGGEKYNHWFPLFKRNIYRWDEALVFSSSDTVAQIYVNEFEVSPQRVKVTGYPRIDSFFSQKNGSLGIFNKIKKSNRKNVGIYIPHDNFDLFLSNIELINSRLQTMNTLLLVRPYKYPPDLEKYEGLKNIYFVRDEDIESDIYQVLPYTDFLITDYSSVFFDYALLDKPMIFSPLELPVPERKFFYDYSKTVPGPQCCDWEETLDAISKSMADPAQYSAERKSVVERFNKYHNGDNSLRVYEEITSFFNLKD